MTPEPDRQRWRVLVVCLAVGFVTTLDVSIVNVALPSIESSLDAGPSQLQLVVAGYTLAFGLALVPAGRLGDAGGRRRLFITGLVGFATFSLTCGLAPTDDLLGAARLLQGVSAGLLNPQVVGLIQQLFAGPERGRAFGLFGATIGVSTAIGPLLGGLIIIRTQPQERGCNLGFRIGSFHFITGELLRQKAIESLILVERPDDVVSIAPSAGLGSVPFVTIRLCVADDVQPMSGPAFAILRTRQKVVHHL